jgi:hypothetical protein
MSLIQLVVEILEDEAAYSLCSTTHQHQQEGKTPTRGAGRTVFAFSLELWLTLNNSEMNDAYLHYHHGRFEGISNQRRSNAQPFGQGDSKPG